MVAVASDVTQMTSRATSSPQSTSTPRHQMTSISQRQTRRQTQQSTSDDQSSHRLQLQTQASIPGDAAVAVVTGAIPLNDGLVERVRHSSSTSVASVSTDHEPPPYSSVKSAAPSRQRRQRSGQRSVDRLSSDKQTTPRAKSSWQSALTRSQAVSNIQATSTSQRQTAGRPRQPSSDDQSSHHLQSQTQTLISDDAAVAMVTGAIPVNDGLVERMRHSSSTSAADVDRGPPPPLSTAPSRPRRQRRSQRSNDQQLPVDLPARRPSSTTNDVTDGGPLTPSLIASTAPSRPRRQHRSRQHSAERQLPVDLPACRPSSTTNDVSESQTVVSSDRLTSRPPTMTNGDDVVVTPRQSNGAAAAAAATVKPVTGNVYGQAPSEHDVTAPVPPPSHDVTAPVPSLRRRHSSTPSLYSHSSGVTTSTAKQNGASVKESREHLPSLTTEVNRKSVDDTESSKHAGGRSIDADNPSTCLLYTSDAADE